MSPRRLPSRVGARMVPVGSHPAGPLTFLIREASAGAGLSGPVPHPGGRWIDRVNDISHGPVRPGPADCQVLCPPDWRGSDLTPTRWGPLGRLQRGFNGLTPPGLPWDVWQLLDGG